MSSGVFCRRKIRTTIALVGVAFGGLLLSPMAGAQERAGAVKEIDFAGLAACPLFAPGEDEAMPQALRAVVGREVRITGYVLPLRLNGGRVEEFLLMRTQSACCYGRMPAANEFVVSTVKAEGLPLVMDVPVTVEGTLRIDPLILEGAHVQFYRLENVRLSSKP